MPVTMTTVVRRFRFLPLQLTLLLVVVVGLVVVSMLYDREQALSEAQQWALVREAELKKYNMKEVDLDYIRAAGFVDHKIQTLNDDDIADMNDTQLMVAVHSYLDNTDVICRRRIRMGVVGDGGWEVCDDNEVRPIFPCLVYAFSVRDESTFEDDISRVYGCEVHSFNINYSGDDYNRTGSIFLHPYGVGRFSEITPEGKELYTLNDIRTILGHRKRNIDLIKLDIEGGEWPALYGMLLSDSLDNVRQLLVECHTGLPTNIDRLRRAIRVMRSLSEAGFRKFYVHKNPKGSFHHPNFPVVRSKNYELHLLNTRFLKKKPSRLNTQ